jgi:hypothetical protein
MLSSQWPDLWVWWKTLSVAITAVLALIVTTTVDTVVVVIVVTVVGKVVVG